MRIIAGSARGRSLVSPNGLSTRPTTDKVREAIFNVLMSEVSGSRVLDVFAGTGALALEALSRGAEEAFLIEKSSRAVKAIVENIKKCGFENAQFISGDCLRIIPGLEKSFDIIFLDPPYGSGLLIPVLQLIISNNILAPDGILVIETSAKEKVALREFGEDFGGLPLTVKKQSRYGNTVISYCSINT